MEDLFGNTKFCFVHFVFVVNTPHVLKFVTSALFLRRHIAMLAIERHNTIQTRHVTKENSERVASRWILSCFSKLLCISMGIRVARLSTEGGRWRGRADEYSM
jgi:hypothetical protein